MTNGVPQPLRIGFICGKYEEYDGISEYVSVLASALAERGHHVVIVGLCQPADTAGPASKVLSASNTLLLSESEPWLFRVAAAAEFLNAHAIAHLSLQFFCYHFGNRRGLVHQLGWYLPKLTNGRTLSVMFHELWLRQEVKLKFTERLKGWARELCVRWLLGRGQAKSLVTSNQAFAATLRKLRPADVTVLPIFSAIPRQQPELGFLEELLGWAGDSRAERSRSLVCVHFGAIKDDWSGRELVDDLIARTSAGGLNLVFLLLGRQYTSAVWDRLNSDYGNIVRFQNLGEMGGREISWILSQSDLGISSTAASLLGKSSSFAAMQDHGLMIALDEPRTSSVPAGVLCRGELKDRLSGGTDSLRIELPVPRLQYVASSYEGLFTSLGRSRGSVRESL